MSRKRSPRAEWVSCLDTVGAEQRKECMSSAASKPVPQTGKDIAAGA